MTDTPGGRARAAAARPPAAGRAGARRAVHVARRPTRSVELTPGAGGAGRPPVVERPLGRLPRRRRRDPVHHHLLVLRARRRSASASRGSTPRPTPSRSPRSSAATTCTRPTARAATAPTARAASGRRSTARTSCSPTCRSTTSNNMMVAGGRYACGNANSVMPVWSNEGNPPGPLNYIQIDDLIAFIRAPSNETYTIRDPDARRAEARPDHQRGPDVQRLGRRQLQAGTRRDAVPGLLVGRVRGRLGRAVRVRPAAVGRPERARRSTSPRPASRSRRPDVTAPAGQAVRDRVRQPGRRARRTTSRSRTRPARSSSRATTFNGVATQAVPGAGARGRDATRSCARCTRTMTGTLTVK